MSIQTDLTRLQSAKAAIKAAIEGKGVTVPDATMLDGMAPLIESIQAGGGGKVSFANGTVTFESDTTFDGMYPYNNIKITHDSGFFPIAFYMYRGSSSSTYPFRFLSMILNVTNVNNSPETVGFYFTLEKYKTSTSQSVSKISSSGYNLNTYWTDTFIRPFYPNADIKIQAGVAVNWFIVGVEGATV